MERLLGILLMGLSLLTSAIVAITIYDGLFIFSGGCIIIVFLMGLYLYVVPFWSRQQDEIIEISNEEIEKELMEFDQNN